MGIIIKVPDDDDDDATVQFTHRHTQTCTQHTLHVVDVGLAIHVNICMYTYIYMFDV